jgi:alpha/beta superfamily hydrolase
LFRLLFHQLRNFARIIVQIFPDLETKLIIPGQAGDIEAIATPVRPEVSPRAAVAVICHPHPLFGGTMNNKVISTVARAFGDLGLSTVRFNFRGVGKSSGVFNEGVGEVQDVLDVAKWALAACPDSELWLAGFSFGAAMSATAATQINTAQLVSIAPPVPRFNLPELPAVLCPWLIVQGDLDEVVSASDVYAWAEQRTPLPTVIRIADATHFFHGKLLELRTLLENALANSGTDN